MRAAGSEWGAAMDARGGLVARRAAIGTCGSVAPVLGRLALLVCLAFLAPAASAQAQDASSAAPERLKLPARPDVPPRGYTLSAVAVTKIAASEPNVSRETGAANVSRETGRHGPATAVLTRPAPVAGRSPSTFRPSRRTSQRGDRAGHRRRSHRPRPGDLDRAAGRLDDGARDPGPVRPCGECSVGLDRAVPAVRRSVPASATADSPPGPRGPARVLDLLCVLRRRATWTCPFRPRIRCCSTYSRACSGWRFMGRRPSRRRWLCRRTASSCSGSSS